MKMASFKSRWARLQQNLPAFVFVLIVQIWLNFKIQPFIPLQSPFDIAWKIVISVFCILVYLQIILFPEYYERMVTLAFLDDFPNPQLAKKIYRIGMLMVVSATLLYFWHIDFYRVTDAWYVILYSHFVITFTLIYRIIKNSLTEQARTKE